MPILNLISDKFKRICKELEQIKMDLENNPNMDSIVLNRSIGKLNETVGDLNKIVQTIEFTDNSTKKVTDTEKINLIKYLCNFYYKDKIILSSENLLYKINEICYCETKNDLNQLSNPRS